MSTDPDPAAENPRNHLGVGLDSQERPGWAAAAEGALVRDTASSGTGAVWILVLVPLWSLLIPVAVVLGLLGLTHEDGVSALVGLVGILVTVGSLCGFRAWMRRQGAARSWELPLVVLTAVVVGVLVGFLRLEWGVAERLTPVASVFWCLVLAYSGAAVVWAMRPGVRRVVVAVGVVVALCAVVTGVAWWQKRVEDVRENQELGREVAAVESPIAALEAPGWEPVAVHVQDDQVPVKITYEPSRGVVREEGFHLEVSTVVEDAGEPGESGLPFWVRCSEGEEEDGCERHGSVMVFNGSDESIPSMNALVEIEDGVLAYLTARVPQSKDGAPEMEMPDLDMVELAAQVRGLEGEEAQGVVEEVL
ncbi:hypothetical protein [Nocardiopsis sp. L17-MgMaSL7]|uniref:hypothetical protein n=1 Tax=Nocardiopsis sp. L17-MgMaSL7 TaxID=1938893 RepID=UPI000D97BC5B|nr:hypothetical protein [Nocardiopsis sp. L17-MgMaSL7]PWV55109.1 hypothetical protein BDW27_103111 [Nocardiopsis sp. L17-MgMaSL7]